MAKIIDISFLLEIQKEASALLTHMELEKYGKNYRKEVLSRFKVFKKELDGVIKKAAKDDKSLIVDYSYFIDILYMRNMLYHIDKYVKKDPTSYKETLFDAISKMLVQFDSCREEQLKK